MQEGRITKAVLDALAEESSWDRDQITLEIPLIEFSLDSLDNQALILKIEENLGKVTTSKDIEKIFEDKNKTVADLIMAVRKEFPQFDDSHGGSTRQVLTESRQKHVLLRPSFGMDSFNHECGARFHFKSFPALKL